MVLELDWVLRGATRLPGAYVIRAFDGLKTIRQVHLEQDELMARALEWHRQGLDCADAFHLARSEGCGAMVSFDRPLAHLASLPSLKPEVKEPG